MTTISAKMIAHSKHAVTGKEIATLLLRYPRCIHAEFMTHRQFSRNASSSRAVPVKKLIQDVLDDPFVPLHWGKNQKGMQAHEECDEQVAVPDLYSMGPASSVEFAHGREQAWLAAMHNAVEAAERFAKAGYHKQIVNRLLEPFSHITVVVTATEWSNFFALRDHPDAEPHIAMLAREMKKAFEASTPAILQPGEWHLPFADGAGEDWPTMYHDMGMDGDEIEKAWIKLSVARCASTSYKTVDGFDMTADRAIDLHDKLVSAVPLHASPCEHQAYADEMDAYGCYYMHPELHGNFDGWCQYRKTLVGECQ